MTNNFQEALDILERVKRDLSHDAKDRALEGVDEVMLLVLAAEKACEEGGPYKKRLLESLTELAQAFAPMASLMNTLIQLIQ